MEVKGLDELLQEIFNQSPIPNRLKRSKQDWLKGKLGLTGASRIVEEYSDWKVEVRCVPKSKPA